MTVTPEPPEEPQDPQARPGGSDIPDAVDGATPPGAGPAQGPSGPARPLSDTDVDALFDGIVADLGPSMRWGLRRADPAPGAATGSAAGPGDEHSAAAAESPGQPGPSEHTVADGPGTEDERSTAPERARRADREAREREITRRERERRARERAQRREFRRVEREAELAAFEAHEAEVRADRDADREHFDPPEPPPVPRPRGRTLAALLCLVAGLVLLVRPGLLAVAPDAALVLSVLLLFGGAGLLVRGLRSRGDGGDDPDDGAVV